MFKKSSWRKVLALPAALSLALGGALLAASPAAAAPGALTVTSPTGNTQVDSRTVTFSGGGSNGSSVTVVDPEGDIDPVPTPALVVDGRWTLSVTFAADAAQQQTVTVQQLTDGAVDDDTTISFRLPAAPTPEPVLFEITKPTEGEKLTSRTVEIAGTGVEGATVVLTDLNGAALPGTGELTIVDGAWSATVTFPDDAATLQAVRATQTAENGDQLEDTVSFALPAVVPPPAPDVEFTITSPTEEAELESRTVEFTGTGTTGSTVELIDDYGDTLNIAPIVVVDGEWSATIEFAEDADEFQYVTAVQTTDGEETGEASVFFSFVVELLPAPSITSPSNGETVVGDQVTFEGTGEPGANVMVFIIPTSLLEELEEDLADEFESELRSTGTDTLERAAAELGAELGAGADLQAAVEAAAEPVDPTEPIVVGANGAWSVTIALPADDYTALAILIDGPETGYPISEPSNEVAFSLVAAAAPGAGPGAGDGPGDGLAVTGNESTGFLGLAAVLAALGAVLVVASRRAGRAVGAGNAESTVSAE